MGYLKLKLGIKMDQKFFKNSRMDFSCQKSRKVRFRKFWSQLHLNTLLYNTNFRGFYFLWGFYFFRYNLDFVKL